MQLHSLVQNVTQVKCLINFQQIEWLGFDFIWNGPTSGPFQMLWLDMDLERDEQSMRLRLTQLDPHCYFQSFSGAAR